MTYTEKLKVLYGKYKSYVNYFIVGVLTTGVNFAAYFVMRLAFDAGAATANAVGWCLSVLFAFFTNKKYVFESETHTISALLWQIVTFFGARALSGAFETASMWLFVDHLGFVGWQELGIKIIVGIIVLIFNYVLSKVLVFRDKKPPADPPGQP